MRWAATVGGNVMLTRDPAHFLESDFVTVLMGLGGSVCVANARGTKCAAFLSQAATQRISAPSSVSMRTLSGCTHFITMPVGDHHFHVSLCQVLHPAARPQIMTQCSAQQALTVHQSLTGELLCRWYGVPEFLDQATPISLPQSHVVTAVSVPWATDHERFWSHKVRLFPKPVPNPPSPYTSPPCPYWESVLSMSRAPLWDCLAFSRPYK